MLLKGPFFLMIIGIVTVYVSVHTLAEVKKKQQMTAISKNILVHEVMTTNSRLVKILCGRLLRPYSRNLPRTEYGTEEY